MGSAGGALWGTASFVGCAFVEGDVGLGSVLFVVVAAVVFAADEGRFECAVTNGAFE